MTTLIKRGSGTPATTGTTWASLTNAVDGTAGTNGVTYATMTSTTASAVATIEITGYDFASSIASVDTLNSVSVALRHFENNTGRFVSVKFQAFDGATAIGSETTATLATAARTDTATPAVTLAQLRSSTFKIKVTITGAAATQSRVFSLDQIDVTADYTPLPPAITQAAYRIYDDGTETGATALAAQDTAANGDITNGDGIGQLRIRLQSTTAVAVPSTDDWQLQWEKNAGGTWTNVVSPPGLLDSYPSSNRSDFDFLDPTQTVTAQSFLGDGRKLSRFGAFLNKNTETTGTFTAVLYAHTGTFGSGGVPTGSILTTSTTSVAASSLGIGYVWVYFDFDETFTLTSGTPYFIGVRVTGANGTGYSAIGSDNTSPTHPGNVARLTGGWAASALSDYCFEVYTGGVTPTTAVAYASPNTTDGAATTNRLGAGSGSFVAGKISETGLVTDLGWTANNYTELLYPVTIKKPDVVAGDVIRFRVLRNGATTGMTYTAVPTVNVVQGGGGPATTTSAWGALTATAVGVDERVATIATSWGAVTHTAIGIVEVTATVTTSWGGWTATATGTVSTAATDWPATITTGWGAFTATASATVTHDIAATVSSSWGTWTATAIATDEHPATITTGWGTWTAIAIGRVDYQATIAISWGAWAATASPAVIDHPATTQATWGAWAATATIVVSRTATITSPWGGWDAHATATTPGVVFAFIDTTWTWTATANGTIIAVVVVPATITSGWGGWSATATGQPFDHRATITSSWGPWSAGATATQDHAAHTSVTWGPFTALATSTITHDATITTSWGGWNARALQEGFLAARIDSTWGPMTATAVGVHLAVWGQWNGHAVTDIWWGDQNADDYLMLV